MISEFRKSFSLGRDYLKTVIYTLFFYASVFLAINLSSQYIQGKSSFYRLLAPEQLNLVPKEQLEVYNMMVIVVMLLAVIAVIAAYTIFTYLIYKTIAKKRFSAKTALKFIPAFAIICLVLFIPFAFAAKLGLEQNTYLRAVSSALFIILLAVYFHLSNIAYYFLALENRLWLAVKRAFSQELKKFIVPYVSAAAVAAVLAVIGLLRAALPNTAYLAITMVISAFFINWLRFFTANSALKGVSGRKI